MKTVGVHEVKTRFSELLRGVEPGDEVVVTRAIATVARIVPMASEPAATTSRFGLLEHEVADPATGRTRTTTSETCSGCHERPRYGVAVAW